MRISDWSSDVCSSDLELLETLADFDDSLLEQLLEDVVPSKDEIYGYLTKDLREDLIVPVFLGAAERGNGVFRLMTSEDRLVGKEFVTTFRPRWSPSL